MAFLPIGHPCSQTLTAPTAELGNAARGFQRDIEEPCCVFDRRHSFDGAEFAQSLAAFVVGSDGGDTRSMRHRKLDEGMAHPSGCTGEQHGARRQWTGRARQAKRRQTRERSRGGREIVDAIGQGDHACPWTATHSAQPT